MQRLLNGPFADVGPVGPVGESELATPQSYGTVLNGLNSRCEAGTANV